MVVNLLLIELDWVSVVREINASMFYILRIDITNRLADFDIQINLDLECVCH